LKDNANLYGNYLVQTNSGFQKPEDGFRISNEGQAIDTQTQIRGEISEENKKSLVELANECLSNSIISQFSKELYHGENTGKLRNSNYNENIKNQNQKSLRDNEKISYSNASIKFGSVDFENERKVKELNANNINPSGIRKTYDANNIKSLAYQDTLNRNPFIPPPENSSNQDEYNQNQIYMKYNPNFLSSQENPYPYIYIKDENITSNIRNSIEEEENVSSAEVTSEENFTEDSKNIKRDSK